MILVAFVLVVLATVALIIGTLFSDGGVSLAWILVAIGACLATFVVLGISWMGRRRAEAGPAARPEPLAGGTTRPAPLRAAEPRATTVGGGGEGAVAVAERPTDEVEESVQVVPAPKPAAPAATPAPRKVAPRRVVQRPAAPAAQDEVPPVQAAPTAPADPAPATQPTRVVRRVAAAGSAQPAAASTTRVVRRAAPAAQQRVVKRTVTPAAGQRAAATPGQRTVTRKVVRRAPATGAAAPAAAGGADEVRALLAGVKGVGPAKQDALVERFGTIDALASAAADEIASVRGVGASVAAEIKKALRAR